MNKRELQKFEKLLLKERERLVSEVQQLEEENLGESEKPLGEDMSSFAEVGTESWDRETALRVAGAESETVRDIDDALERIKAGTFGVCEGTGEQIPKARLEVFPWARYTVQYQEKVEREGMMNTR
jgi:DnaK suppressor protein